MNRQKQKSKSMSAGSGSASTSGATTKKATGGHSDASSKIQESSQKLITKAVVRIAWYPVVPLVTALPLALNMSVAILRSNWQFAWFCAIINNFQVSFILHRQASATSNCEDRESLMPSFSIMILPLLFSEKIIGRLWSISMSYATIQYNRLARDSQKQSHVRDGEKTCIIA